MSMHCSARREFVSCRLTEPDRIPVTLKHIVEVGLFEKCLMTFVNPFLEWRSTWEVS